MTYIFILYIRPSFSFNLCCLHTIQPIAVPFLTFLRDVWEKILLFLWHQQSLPHMHRNLGLSTFLTLFLVSGSKTLDFEGDRDLHHTLQWTALLRPVITVCWDCCRNRRTWFSGSRIQSMNTQSAYIVPGNVLGSGESKIKKVKPCPGWCGLVGWSVVLCTERLQDWFPVRAHT